MMQVFIYSIIFSIPLFSSILCTLLYIYIFHFFNRVFFGGEHQNWQTLKCFITGPNGNGIDNYYFSGFLLEEGSLESRPCFRWTMISLVWDHGPYQKGWTLAMFIGFHYLTHKICVYV